MRGLIIVVLGLMVSGCTYYQWVKPGATPEVFDHDSDVCKKDVLKYDPDRKKHSGISPERQCPIDWNIVQEPPCGFPAGKAISELFGSCMRASGWSLVEDE